MREYFRMIFTCCWRDFYADQDAKKIFEKKNIFKQAIPYKKSTFLGSRIVLWDEIWFLGIIFDANHDRQNFFFKIRKFPIISELALNAAIF